MNYLVEDWLRFEYEFLLPLAHHYTDEDEDDLVEPLRCKILGNSYVRIENFTIIFVDSAYSIFSGSYQIGIAQEASAVVQLVANYIKAYGNSWYGMTAEQFAKSWNELHIPKWRDARGKLWDVKDMDVNHIRNALAMLRRKGFISPNLVKFYIACAEPQGEMAQEAFYTEFDTITQPTSKFIDIFEARLKELDNV